MSRPAKGRAGGGRVGREAAVDPASAPPRATQEGFYARVYAAVCEVPRGRVTTYGLISELVIGHSRAARTVGWALRALPEPRHDEVPWWRVINAQGRISNSNRELPAEEQRRRLEAEAVRFGPDERVDLERYGWWG